MIETLELVLHYLVEATIPVFELIGVGIIIVSGIRGFYSYVCRKGLEFKLGSEILRTVVVREWTEIATVAGIIALRAALTFLIHWEIKEEEKGVHE